MDARDALTSQRLTAVYLPGNQWVAIAGSRARIETRGGTDIVIWTRHGKDWLTLALDNITEIDLVDA